MPNLHSGYFAFPVLNTHRSRQRILLTYQPLRDVGDPRVQQIIADYARRGQKLNLNRLVDPTVQIAKGRESTVVPPAVFPSHLAFVEKVLETLEQDKECGLDDAVKERLKGAAEDRQAEEFYVLPSDFRVLAHDGKIDADVALALTRGACNDTGPQNFVPWTGEFELRAEFRDVQQVLLKVEFDGPCILDVAIHVPSYNSKVRIGSFLVPFLDDRFDAG